MKSARYCWHRLLPKKHRKAYPDIDIPNLTLSQNHARGTQTAPHYKPATRREDPVCSLAMAVVKGATEEAYQALWGCGGIRV